MDEVEEVRYRRGDERKGKSRGEDEVERKSG